MSWFVLLSKRMSGNKTSAAVEAMLAQIETFRKNPLAEFKPLTTDDINRLAAAGQKFKQMEEALWNIKNMKQLTFAECTDAETIMSLAEDAYDFDPLNDC